MIRWNYNIYLLVISCEEIFLHVWNETINDKVNNTKPVRREICLLSLVLTAIYFLRSLGFWFWKKKTIEDGISNCLPEVKVSWSQYQFYFIKNILDIVAALTLWFRVLMLTEMIFRVRQRKYPAMISTLAFFRNADLEVCLKVAFTSFQAIFNTLNPGWTVTFKKAR